MRIMFIHVDRKKQTIMHGSLVGMENRVGTRKNIESAKKDHALTTGHDLSSDDVEIQKKLFIIIRDGLFWKPSIL